MSYKINTTKFSLPKFFIKWKLFNKVSFAGDNRWKFALDVGNRIETTDGGIFMIFFFWLGVLNEWGRVEAGFIVAFINLGREVVVVFLFVGPFEAKVFFLLFVI